MQVRALAKHVRISPLKVRRVVNLIRGKELNEAMNILNLTHTKSSRLVAKVVKSAAANAENNFELNTDNLYVSEISANQGAVMKRFRAGSMGRAIPRTRRTTHIEVVLKEKE